MCRKLIHYECEEIPWAIFLESDCFEHACHLCVLGSLKVVDAMMTYVLPTPRRWRYYSSIATVCNVCRDVARELFETWRKLYKDEAAMKHARKLFPRCCGGRWLSIDGAEKRILSCKDMLWTVLTTVLRTKVRAANTCPATDNDFSNSNPGDVTSSEGTGSMANKKNKVGTSACTVGQVDLLAAEQTEQYTNMMGRWRKHAVEAVSDPLWQRTIAVLNQVKMPLTHFSCFLKKVVSEKEMLSRGNTLHQLVCGRSESFLREFDDLLCFFPHF